VVEVFEWWPTPFSLPKWWFLTCFSEKSIVFPHFLKILVRWLLVLAPLYLSAQIFISYLWVFYKNMSRRHTVVWATMKIWICMLFLWLFPSSKSFHCANDDDLCRAFYLKYFIFLCLGRGWTLSFEFLIFQERKDPLEQILHYYWWSSTWGLRSACLEREAPDPKSFYKALHY
jgi:hypothetical protein